jgi:hypothetical protein
LPSASKNTTTATEAPPSPRRYTSPIHNRLTRFTT